MKYIYIYIYLLIFERKKDVILKFNFSSSNNFSLKRKKKMFSTRSFPSPIYFCIEKLYRAISTPEYLCVYIRWKN